VLGLLNFGVTLTHLLTRYSLNSLTDDGS